jgi:hypothetical protein
MTTETQERTYHTIDKTGWPKGPWDDEADKYQYRDDATGLPCLINRTPTTGSLCGYVAVPPGHPAYEHDYDDVDVVVHGGLTYSDRCQAGPEDRAICHIPEPGEPDDVWWLGWDASHGGDLMPVLEALLGPVRPPYGVYRDIAYVRSENAQLAAQLAVMTARDTSA